MTEFKAVMVVFFTIFAAIAVVAAVVGLIMYIFQAIGMYSLSKRRKLGTSAFAWIPILNAFKMGQIADDAVLHKRGTRSHFMVLMPVFSIAGGVLYGIGSFLTLIAFNFSASDISNIIGHGMNDLPYLIRSGNVSEGSMITGMILIIIAYIFILIASVMEYIVLYHIYKSCSTSYTAYFILSLIFAITIPFFLFAIRKKDNPEFYKDPVPEHVA